MTIRNYYFSSISILLILLFPILLLRHHDLGFISLISLSLLGLYKAVKNRKNIFDITAIRYNFIIFYGFLLLTMFLSFLPEYKFKVNYITKVEILLALSPLISYAIKISNVTIERLIPFFKIALILAGIYVFYKNFGQENISDRVLWPSWIGVLLFIFTLIKINNKNKNVYAYIFDLIYYTASVYAIFECSQRMAIIALCLLIPLVFYFNIYLISKNNRNRNAIDFFLVYLIIIISIFCNLNTNNRLKEMIYKSSEILEIKQNQKPGQIDFSSTFDQRIVLLQSGLKSFYNKPIFGQGYKNTNKSIIKYYPPEIKSTYLMNMTHVHNSYINILVQGGIFGLFFYILLFIIIPFIIFLNSFIKKKGNPYSILGMLLIIGYCILGIGETMYLGLFEISFYIFFTSYFMNKSTN